MFITTNSEWVTAIRYYRGLEASKAPTFLGTKRPAALGSTFGAIASALAYGTFVIALVVITVLAAVGTLS